MRSGAMQGLVIGKVVDNADPEREGRIRARFPWLDNEIESDWFPVAAPFAGDDRGVFFMPEIDDEIVMGFLQGDFNHPIMLGALWNGQAAPPAGDHRHRMIKSTNGHRISFVDSTPSGGTMGALIIEDAHENIIVMGNGVITIRSKGVLQLAGASVVINGRVVQPSPNPI